MKVLGNLSVDKDTNAKYPLGSNIQNETDTLNGTPVVREIYGDILMNLYRILELTNITPTDTEDNKDTQFQLVEALKKLPNSLNDTEQVLTLSGSVWSVPFDLSILPNKYFFIARASENFVDGTSYTFKGTGAIELPFTSSGFNGSDELLIIIDNSTVRAYSLIKLSENQETLSLLINSPLQYNLSNELYYFVEGILYKNLEIFNLQQKIIENYGSTKQVKYCSFMQGYAVCVVFDTDTENWSFYAFELSDLNTPFILDTDWIQIENINYFPSFYFDDNCIYATNSGNTSSNNNLVMKIVFMPDSQEVLSSSIIEFDENFKRELVNGSAIKSDVLYQFDDATKRLDGFNINTGILVEFGEYPISKGFLFNFKNSIYCRINNIAHKLNL
jgi:hypothetical protein